MIGSTSCLSHHVVQYNFTPSFHLSVWPRAVSSLFFSMSTTWVFDFEQTIEGPNCLVVILEWHSSSQDRDGFNLSLNQCDISLSDTPAVIQSCANVTQHLAFHSVCLCDCNQWFPSGPYILHYHHSDTTPGNDLCLQHIRHTAVMIMCALYVTCCSVCVFEYVTEYQCDGLINSMSTLLAI